jgi:hypothetical protein
MKICPDIQERPDVSVEERAFSQLVKRVRKLRWIGMDREAQRMQMSLRRVHPADASLSDPFGARALQLHLSK